MKNVYVVSFEHKEAFTTARKAIESAKQSFGGASIYYITSSSKYDNRDLDLGDVPTVKLIALLNKGATIVLSLGGMDFARIEKLQVN